MLVCRVEVEPITVATAGKDLSVGVQVLHDILSAEVRVGLPEPQHQILTSV
jgi:hypothetical protein